MTKEAVSEENLLCVLIQKDVTFSTLCVMDECLFSPLLYTASLLCAEFVGFYLISNFDSDFSRCILCLCKCTISDAQAF